MKNNIFNDITWTDIEIYLSLHKYIIDYITKDKFIGQIIYKELISKVFDPIRLFKICNKYNMEVKDLIEVYY